MPVRFENVFYVYQAHSPFASSALNDINVSLNSHDFLALVGHTGSGKSTFAQQINALLKPTDGKVFVGELIPFEIQKKLSSLAEGVYAYNGLFEGYDLYEGYVDHQLSFVALIKDELILICESKKFALVAYQDENNFCPVMKKVKSIKQELLPQDVKEAYLATKEFDDLLKEYKVQSIFSHFSSPVAPPFIVWTSSTQNFGADNIVFKENNIFGVELYSRTNILEEEASLEAFFDSKGLFWEKESQEWLDEEKVHYTRYSVY